jgi:MFS family permease
VTSAASAARRSPPAEGPDSRSPEAEDAVFTLTAVYGLVTVVTAFVGGWWSDRVGRRKVFVIWSGLIAAAALVLFAFVPTLPAAYVGAVVLGLGLGYPGLYLLAAAVSILGSVLVRRIRSVD